MKKWLSLALSAVLLICVLTSCGHQSAGTESESTSPVVSGDVSNSDGTSDGGQNAPDYTGVINPITGLYNLTPSAAGMRFYTMTIGNSTAALPQHGLANADMIYEMMVEGGITRLMPFFADIDKVGDTVIGSCRSARTNIIATAVGYDAFFGHYGGSKSGYNMINDNGVDDLDGMAASSDYFWRDQWRKKNLAFEHSAMTNGTKLKALANKKGYRLKMKDPSYTVFTFNQDGTIADNGATSPATSVTVTFSKGVTSGFEYDAQSGNYLKFRDGKAHIDGNTNEQLSFKNVIVITDHHSYEGDNYHLVVDQVSGSGTYFCDGQAVPVKWSKGALKNPYKFTKEDGSDLLVTPGKTYVCVARLNSGISFS